MVTIDKALHETGDIRDLDLLVEIDLWWLCWRRLNSRFWRPMAGVDITQPCVQTAGL